MVLSAGLWNNGVRVFGGMSRGSRMDFKGIKEGKGGIGVSGLKGNTGGLEVVCMNRWKGSMVGIRFKSLYRF